MFDACHSENNVRSEGSQMLNNPQIGYEASSNSKIHCPLGGRDSFLFSILNCSRSRIVFDLLVQLGEIRFLQAASCERSLLYETANKFYELQSHPVRLPAAWRNWTREKMKNELTVENQNVGTTISSSCMKSVRLSSGEPRIFISLKLICNLPDAFTTTPRVWWGEWGGNRLIIHWLRTQKFRLLESLRWSYRSRKW